MVDRLAEFVVPYQQALEAEAAHPMHLYLQGLLSHLQRKNAEEIATLVDIERQVIQDFIGIVPWDHRPLVTVLVGQAGDRLGEPDGIIAFDPSSFPKRGTHSVGVKRQWCGHRGKVDNCQVGVFMGYVSRHDHALLDFRLYLPGEWTRDELRRQECHVPPDVRYQTRQEQCLEMLDAWGDQVPHGWVTGDDELGRHTQFRQSCASGRALGARGTLQHHDSRPGGLSTRVLWAWTAAESPLAIGDRLAQVARPTAWTRLTVRDGEKGLVAIEMVRRRVQTRIERKRMGPQEWLVVTRRALGRAHVGAPRLSRCHRSRHPTSLPLN